MKKLLLAFALLLTILTVPAVPLTVVSASPANVFEQACKNNKNDPLCKKNADAGLFDVIGTVIKVMITIGGVIAVIVIIIGGLRYMTSSGEQANIKAAKDTILYAVIGLVVTIVAFAIVTWVVSKL